MSACRREGDGHVADGDADGVVGPGLLESGRAIPVARQEVDLVVDLTTPRALVEIDGLGSEVCLRERSPSFERLDTVVTRSLDVLLSVVAIVLLTPLMLAIGLAILATSRGPVLYSQERCGRDGTGFRMLKFRTMDVDADQRDDLDRLGGPRVDAPAYKSPDDPRVTPLGRVLRRASLDELPQLFNILAGRMAFVGPRPLVWAEADCLGPTAFAARHAVRPGLTGSWQVERTATTSFVDRIAMDVHYAATRTLSTDVRLLLRTPSSAIRGNGCF